VLKQAAIGGAVKSVQESLPDAEQQTGEVMDAKKSASALSGISDRRYNRLM